MVSIKINSWYKEKNGRFYSSKTKGYNLGDSLSESSENWTEKAKGEVSIYVIWQRRTVNEAHVSVEGCCKLLEIDTLMV